MLVVSVLEGALALVGRRPWILAFPTPVRDRLLAVTNLVSFLEHNTICMDRDGALFETGSSNITWSFCVPSLYQAECPKHAAMLSIKSTFSGQELYEIDGRATVLVDPSSYLILNEGSEYTCLIDTPITLKSFCIFFRAGLADEVLSGIELPSDLLLTDPAARLYPPVRFLESLYPHGDLMTGKLLQFHSLIIKNGHSDAGLEEWYHSLLETMLRLQGIAKKAAEELPFVRYATRMEIYRRLYLARDYISSCSDSKLMLRDMAAVANLSPHHFLRLFKQLFQETPHQYLIRRRLDRAQDLLSNTRMDISWVCHKVGFESIGSFTTLFRRRVGISPAQFRELTNRSIISRRAIFNTAYAEKLNYRVADTSGPCRNVISQERNDRKT